MNTIDFNKNDFPLTTDVLAFLQSAISIIENLTNIIKADQYILKGCITTGSSVSSGYVVVNGEVIPFEGGALQTYVRVVSTETPIVVDGYTYTTTTKRLVFGAGENQIEWNLFQKITPEWSFLALDDALVDGGTLGYLKDSAGNIHIWGYQLSLNTEWNLYSFGTLPEGFRPYQALSRQARITSDTDLEMRTCQLDIYDWGPVRIKTPSGTPNITVGYHVDFYEIFRPA